MCVGGSWFLVGVSARRAAPLGPCDAVGRGQMVLVAQALTARVTAGSCTCRGPSSGPRSLCCPCDKHSRHVPLQPPGVSPEVRWVRLCLSDLGDWDQDCGCPGACFYFPCRVWPPRRCQRPGGVLVTAAALPLAALQPLLRLFSLCRRSSSRWAREPGEARGQDRRLPRGFAINVFKHSASAWVAAVSFCVPVPECQPWV